MKRFHHVTVSVFVRKGEPATVLDAILPVPVARFLQEQHVNDAEHHAKVYALPAEHAELRVQEAPDDENPLMVLTFRFAKQTHTNQLFARVLGGVSPEDRAAFTSTAMLRTDEHGRLFVRLDRHALAQGRLVLTDGGDCVHCAFLIAAFPKNPLTIRAALKELLAVGS